jgi:hypothetical protein
MDACLVLGSAVVIGITALVFFANTLTFISSAVSVPAKVVEIKCDRDNGICFAPRVLFTEEGGRQLEFAPSLFSHPSAFHAGEQVTVLYSPGRPEKVIVQNFFSIWGEVILLFGMFVAFAVVGACILLFPNAVTTGPYSAID